MNLLCKPYTNQHCLFSLIYSVDFERVSWLSVMLGQVLSAIMLISNSIRIANNIDQWVTTFALHVFMGLVIANLIDLYSEIWGCETSNYSFGSHEIKMERT
jgi:hypothetical protein